MDIKSLQKSDGKVVQSGGSIGKGKSARWRIVARRKKDRDRKRRKKERPARRHGKGVAVSGMMKVAIPIHQQKEDDATE